MTLQAGRRLCAKAQKPKMACIFRTDKQNGQEGGDKRENSPGPEPGETGEPG